MSELKDCDVHSKTGELMDPNMQPDTTPSPASTRGALAPARVAHAPARSAPDAATWLDLGRPSKDPLPRCPPQPRSSRIRSTAAGAAEGRQNLESGAEGYFLAWAHGASPPRLNLIKMSLRWGQSGYLLEPTIILGDIEARLLEPWFIRAKGFQKGWKTTPPESRKPRREVLVREYTETAHVSVRQNDMEELKQIWEDLSRADRQAFIDRYGDIAYLLYVQVNEPMLQALIKFWNLGYGCFTLNSIDLMPTVEEYSELLWVPNIIEDRIYTKPKKNTNMPAQLAAFTGRSEEWASKLISKKGKAIVSLKAQLIAIAISGLVIFPRVLEYIDVALFDVFDKFRYGINLGSAILVETFISLNDCRELEGGCFRGCAQLLYVWIRTHFWKTPKPVLPGIRSMNFSPLREFLAKEWEEVDPTKWVETFLSRQFGSRQFMSFTAGLRESWFALDEKFKDQVLTINKNWKHCYCVKVACDQKSMVTPDYVYWIHTMINDTIPLRNQGQNIPMEDHLRVVPSEAYMLRTKLARAEGMIEKMGLQQTSDLFLAKVHVDKFAGEAEQAMKKYSKLKIEYDVQNADFKKLEASFKHMELRKTLAEWRQEIQQAEDRQKSRAEREIEKERKRDHDRLEFEKTKGRQTIEQYQQALEAEKDNTIAWKGKLHDIREHEDMIREYQTRDEYTELQAGRDKIERLEKEFSRLRNAAHRFQEQDKINEKIMNLTQDIAEHMIVLAREARILRPHVVSNEMKSSLELLFEQIEDLGNRFNLYQDSVLFYPSQEMIIAQLTTLLEKRNGKGKVSEESLNIEEHERAGSHVKI
ncbi:hypothetical protein GQ457_11G030790 [Hibiscus cannabinus]